MSRIELVTGRSVEDVFANLEGYLEKVGYLPEEYFIMNEGWIGEAVPKGSDIFCTADYGSSEGIYLNIFLRWHGEQGVVTKALAIGKTLEESPVAMDRMHLACSAVIQAFHGDGSVHDRYMKQGGQQEENDSIVYLTAEERRILAGALEASKDELTLAGGVAVRLLHRFLGEASEQGAQYRGCSAFDSAMRAVQEGDLDSFQQPLHRVTDHAGELLQQAAGRAVEQSEQELNIGLSM